MIIKKINQFFYPTKNNTYFCRNCCTSYYSELKYKDHIEFCSNEKTLVLMPSKNKYIQFKNIQNTLQLPFVCYADIESYMIVKDKKNRNT